MNIEDAWNQGFTGKGVVVAVLDDGLEWTHPEIIDNYDPQASTDLNSNDPDPSPRYDDNAPNHQGTRIAGIIASTPDDKNCGVGIAYNAKVGGIRILDGTITDSLEEKALSFNPQHIDIYNAGWGPDDDGKTVDGPGQGARNALEMGANSGRHGKGSIYVWASGLGGKHRDNCNCDGYVSSIYTIAIGSVSSRGEFSWYPEQCSASLAVTFSSGDITEPAIVTTTLKGACRVLTVQSSNLPILQRSS